MELVATLQRIAEESLPDPSLFLVEVKVKGKSEEPTFEIVIDGDKGILIDQCVAMSRAMREQLEELIPEVNYSLDVGSPGAEANIKFNRQYNKLIGKTLSLRTNEGEVVEGTLIEKKEESLVLEIKIKKGQSEKKEIALSSISKAKALINI